LQVLAGPVVLPGRMGTPPDLHRSRSTSAFLIALSTARPPAGLALTLALTLALAPSRSALPDYASE